MGAVGAGSAGPGAAGSAGPRIIPDEPACADCSIVLTEIAVLGGPDDPASPREDAVGRRCMVGELASGGFVSSAAVGGGALLVYGPGGDLQRVVGGPGQGPGEFGELVRVTVGPGDSLFVMDDSQSRMQVFDPDDEVVRTFQVPGRFRDFALLPDGRLVFHRTPLAREDPLFYLHAPDGSPETSFGQVVLDEVDLELRLLSPSPGGGFWTASAWRYEIQRFRGEREEGFPIQREAAWFPPDVGLSVDFEAIYETVAPPPLLESIHEDEGGRVWTSVIVPDPSWEPGIPLQPRFEWFNRSFDTVFEVLDVEAGRVLARTSHDERFGKVCGSPLLYQVIEVEGGDTRIRVVRPTLVEG